MSTFPPIAHVALTVRDLSVSVPWYAELLGGQPVLDEDTGPFRHVVWMINGTMLGLHQFPDTDTATPFTERRAGWTTLPSASPTGPSWNAGRSAWTSSAPATAASTTRPTARPCPSATRTACRWSSSPRRPDKANLPRPGHPRPPRPPVPGPGRTRSRPNPSREEPHERSISRSAAPAGH